MKRKSRSMQEPEQLCTNSPSLMEPSQMWKTIWCCGTDADQDVSIRLKAVDPETSQVMEGIVAELKLHSDRLKECSKYFETALSERWLSSETPTIFTLEMMNGLEVEHYSDCFARMYTSDVCNDFKDVKFALGLLRVASQIRYDELVSFICRYLVMVKCCVEVELRIRQHSSSADFLRNRATDLIARLEAEGECEKKQRDLIEGTISMALHEGRPSSRAQEVVDARSTCREWLMSIGLNELNVAFERDMIKIVNEEAKKLVVEFHDDFRPQFIPRPKPPVPRLMSFVPGLKPFVPGLEPLVPGLESSMTNKVSFTPVVKMTPEFSPKLAAICWVLDMVLKAKVADELVECLLNLEMFPRILECCLNYDDSTASIVEFARVLLLVYHEAVAGNLCLGTTEKVQLLVHWWSFYDDIFAVFSDALLRSVEMKEGKSVTPAELKTVLEQVRERVFLTLPIDQQTEIVKKGLPDFFSPEFVVAWQKRNSRA